MAIKSRKSRGRGPGRPSLEEVLTRLDEEVNLLHEHLGGLPRAVEADEILRAIWIDDVHNSTAIEGNTMTRAQVEDLVERRRPSASLVETMEVEGYARAADWVYRHAGEYSQVPLAVVSEVHRIALHLPWEIEPPATGDEAGAWRKGGVRIRAVRVSLPAAVPADLQTWSDSTARRGDVHPITHAAHHHAWFERIHPFVDGNGRVGRLLLNFMLIQAGYPPAVILASQRPRYLRALHTADDGNPNPLAEVVARAVSGTLSRFLIPNLAGEAKLIPLAALAAQGPYPAVYLRQLILANRLRAVREGNLWLSSRAWVRQYIESRDRRGGPVPTPSRAPTLRRRASRTRPA
jgi:cell filamentation protein, protein adenylyltransferase